MSSAANIPDPSGMRKYFESGATRSIQFRKDHLKNLRAALYKYEKPLYEALMKDLGKNAEESWVTEIGFVISEISSTLKSLKEWMAPVRVSTNLVNLPSSSFIMQEPLGVVLIIAPWNYPVNLLLAPLVGAIAAGNCVVLKPSEYAAHTAEVLRTLITETFHPDFIILAEGDGAEVVPSLISNFRFDHIFYTGSTAVGKIIYQLAAKDLVPVTLELGGKSPCIVEKDANISVAAKRIAVTKYSNAGQMCVAPDYLLVHESVKEEFIIELRKSITKFFGEDASASYSYGRIINEKLFDRLTAMLESAKILHGGRFNKTEKYIEPTIIEGMELDQPVMTEEIFGPILPIITFNSPEQAKEIIARNPNPLAFYIYTSSRKKEKYWLEAIPAGGACVNNSSWHLTNHHLPFGGRGFSGSGNYHGKFSFDTFSHRKAVLRTPTWFDPATKYPPYKGKLKLFKWVIK
ncbi:MAG: aldehyde dehydrogenase family protein [Gemmatimonadaceae bacterium]|nr:aldehyde dehydrogenase family protein [Chitinophagaceae bacterium]